MMLSPDETELIGKWEMNGARVTKDHQAQRIKTLVRQHLKSIAMVIGGWDKLFRDPDGRFWELTYPNSSMHGGGPPRLAVVTEEEARHKYGF